VLNAQQDLVNAVRRWSPRSVTAWFASFSVLRNGRHVTAGFGSQNTDYDPVTHYHQIRDAWFGVRTPDGR